MKADEQIGLVVVGDGRALIETDGVVAITGEDHAHAQPSFERRLQPPRDAEGDGFPGPILLRLVRRLLHRRGRGR